MKTRYKFIHFEQDGNNYDGKPVWFCHNNRSGHQIAALIWYKPWRQWVMQGQDDAVFSSDCLEDIQHFIGQLAVEFRTVPA